MKSKVLFSKYCIAITVLVISLFLFHIIYYRDASATVLVIFTILILGSLYYCPTSIEAAESSLKVHRVLSRSKVFSYNNIAEIENCYPSTGGMRICGSGGFFGYWGYFHDVTVGYYFGYYGRKDQAMAVTLKDGKKYVLSCKNPDEIISFVKERIA